MPYNTKEKLAEYHKQWYERNKDKQKANAKRHKALKKKRNIEYVLEHKKGKACLDCGGTFQHYVMQFDHCRGVKRGNVSDMVRQALSIETLKKEIEICDLVCSNCHAVRTHNRRKNATT